MDFKKSENKKRYLRILLILLIILLIAGTAFPAFMLSGKNDSPSQGNSSGNSSQSNIIRDPDQSEISNSAVQGETGDSSAQSDVNTSSVQSETNSSSQTSAQSDVSSKNTSSTENVGSEKPSSSKPSSSKPSASPKTAQGILDSMTLEEKVCQMFIIEHEQLLGRSSAVTSSGEKTKAAIEKYPVGGIVYFAQNIKTPSQCTDMIKNIQSYSEVPLFIAVDEEGGKVARIANNKKMGTTKFPNMASITDDNEAYNVGYTIGSEIKRFGFNLDFAPVADVNSNPDNPVIGVRSFDADPTTVAGRVKSIVKGFNSSGMLCTLKHFPGHGDTKTDSHTGYTEITKTLDELKACEFIPFKSGADAGADFVMVGHLSAPQITGNKLPATLSKKMIDLLKNEVGFNGLIITDSMQMNAITDNYTSSEAAVLAVKAGVDIILMPDNFKNAVNGIVKAVENGEISEARINRSVLKILQTKIDHGIIKQ